MLGISPPTRNVQAARGTWVHKTIHKLHSTGKWGGWGDILYEEIDKEINGEEHGDQPWQATSKDTDDLIEKEKADSTEMIRNYVVMNQHAPVIATEAEGYSLISHPNTGSLYRYLFTIDQLRSAENSFDPRLEVWDMKTDAQAPDPAFLKKSVQVNGYLYGVGNGVLMVNGEPWSLEDPPNRFVWYQLANLVPYKRAGKWGKAGDLRGAPEVAVDRTKEQLSVAVTDICAMIRGIRMGIFYRCGDKMTCKLCRMKDVCDLDDPKALVESAQTVT